MANQLYLEEFLYRGRPPGSDREPAFHVVLGVVGQDAFGRPTVATSGPLTPEQANEHGITLPAALDAINAALIDENAALKAANQAYALRVAELAEAFAQRSATAGEAPADFPIAVAPDA